VINKLLLHLVGSSMLLYLRYCGLRCLNLDLIILWNSNILCKMYESYVYNYIRQNSLFIKTNAKDITGCFYS